TDARFVGREVDPRPWFWESNERRVILRQQAIDKLRGGLLQRRECARGDQRLVNCNDDAACILRSLIRTLESIDRPSRRRRAAFDFDQLCGNGRASLAI